MDSLCTVIYRRPDSLLPEVRFTKSSYLSAVQSLDVVLEELKSLEDSLGPATVAQLYASYKQSGGEQFLQDSQRLQGTARLFRRQSRLFFTILNV